MEAQNQQRTNENQTRVSWVVAVTLGFSEKWKFFPKKRNFTKKTSSIFSWKWHILCEKKSNFKSIKKNDSPVWT